MNKLAEIAKQLLDKGLVKEARELLAEEDDSDSDVMKVVDAILSAAGKASSQQFDRMGEKWWNDHANEIADLIQNRWSDIFEYEGAPRG